MQVGIRVDFNYGKNSCGLKFNWTFRADSCSFTN